MYAIAIIRYRKPLEEVQKHTRRAPRLLPGTEAGRTVDCFGAGDSAHGGVMLLRVPDNEAQATLDSIRDNDPYTRFGVAQYEMWPWAPGFGAEDLDRL